MFKLKRKKNVVEDDMDFDQLVTLPTGNERMFGYHYQGPFMGLYEEMKKSPNSTKAMVYVSIRDGDMALLHKCLEDLPEVRASFTYDTQKGMPVQPFHMACHLNRPHAALLLFNYQREQKGNVAASFSAIAVACQFDNLDVIRVLIENGADLHVSNKMLHVIVRHAGVEIAEYLYGEKNISYLVNAVDGCNTTPLHCVAHRGEEKLCSWLLARGANARAKDSRHMTPFMYACRCGHIKLVPMLVASGHNEPGQCIDDKDDEGMTALHHAVARGQTQVMELLISMGARLNDVTQQGSTPLHLSAAFDHADIIQVLIQAGAIRDARDPSGKSPLHRASEKGSVNAALSLIQAGADLNIMDDGGTTPLSMACSQGHMEIVELLLGFGADYTLTNHLSRSCLHEAVEEGHTHVVNTLLQKCDRHIIALCDAMKMNALHIAAAKSCELVDVLVAYDELINVQDVLGRLPLHIAARFGTHNAVKTLAAVTKDFDAVSNVNKTPLFLACEAGNILAILALKEMGADVNTSDIFDHSTLMMSASNGSTFIVRELILVGAEVNGMDKKKNTPLHYACANGHLSTVKVLLENRASVTTINIDGRNPLLEAVKGLHTDVARYLMAHESWEDSLSVMDEHKDSIVDVMIRKTPEAVKVLLDKCMTKSNHSSQHQLYKIHFYYRYIDPGPDKRGSLNNFKAFQTMIAYKREDLLSHPVCQSLLVLKWRTYGRYNLIVNAILEVLFYGSLRYYVQTVPMLGTVLDDDGCNVNATKQNGTLTNSTEATVPDENNDISHLHFIKIALYVLVGLQAFKTLRFLLSLGWRYFLQPPKVIEFLSVVVMCYALHLPGTEMCKNHWRGMCVAIFILSTNSCMTFFSFDLFGLYFSMFFEVLKGILKISSLLLFFMLVFSLPLSIYLRNQPGFRASDPSILSVLAMTLGELNFRDNIINGDNYPFTFDLYFMFPCFAIVMPIAVMNLMIGSAVGDISKIEKEAYLLRMKNQVSFLMSIEAVPLKRFRQRFYFERYTMQPNMFKGTLTGEIQKLLQNDDRIKFIDKTTEDEGQCELREKIDKQNIIIDSLKEMTKSIQIDLKQLSSDIREDSQSCKNRIKCQCMNQINRNEEDEDNKES